jgi:cell division protein FtsQ
LVIGVFLLVLAGEGIFHFLVVPNLRIEKISLDKDVPLGREEILRIAGIESTPFYYSLDVDTVRRNLESWHSIKSAYVEKVFPDSLRIIIRSRRALAVAFAETAGSTLPLSFDEEGIVFQSGREVADLNLPVISGIRFEGTKAGMRLPAMLTSFFEDLRDLQNSHPAVFAGFSEFRIVKKGDGFFEVLIYPVHHGVPVRIEAGLSAERGKMILMVLDVMNKEGLLGKVEEIDFRTGDVIYRLKEG